MDERIERLADPTSELGMLQRGRGEGFLAALAMEPSVAADLVWQCIVHDPRWDLQVEPRASYYAELVTALDLDVIRLRPHNCPEPEPDVDQRLIIDVLGELACVRVPGAEEVLLDHVANGQQWDDAVYEISRSPGDAYRKLPAVLESRFNEHECVAIVHRWRYEIPWDLLAGSVWVRRALDSFDEGGDAAGRPRPELPSMDLPASELLTYDWPHALPKRLLHRLTNMLRDGELELLVGSLAEDGVARGVAFQALGQMNDPSGIEVASAILETDVSGPSRRFALRYLQDLGPKHTLELARSWLGESDGRGVAASSVLEAHAEPSDSPALLLGLRSAWEQRDFYALCSYVTAFSRIPSAPLELLEEIYQQSEYSYCRGVTAETIAKLSPGTFSAKYGSAAVHDCEARIRDLVMEISR